MHLNPKLPASLIVLGLLLATLGCKKDIKLTTTPIPPPPKAEEVPDPIDLIPVFEAQNWVNAAQLPWDAWYIQYEGGKRIGYFHVQVSKGNSLIRLNRTALREVASEDKVVQYKVSMEAFETINGRFAGFSEDTEAGEFQSSVKAQLARDQLTITTTDAEGKKSKTLAEWESGTWGTLDLQAMFFARPMQPGEQRKAKVLSPKLKKTVTVILTAGNREYTALPGGSTPELLPVTVDMLSDDQVFQSRNWVNDKGEILKSITLGGTMASTFRAPTEIAMQVADEYRLKTLLETSTEFAGDAPTEQERTARYLVESTNFDLYSLWSKNVRQTVKALTALSANVTVNDVSDSKTMATIASESFKEADTLPSPLIRSDHPTIDDLAAKLVANAKTDSEKVVKLTQGLAQLFKPMVFSAAVSTPETTVRNMQGNTVELSMLLTSLIRNRGIPARIASGIRIDRRQEACVFHMWTEAWLDGRWLPVDPITGRVTGIDCLKMLDSSMTQTNPYDAVLPVIDKMNLIRVKRIANEELQDEL